MWADPRPAVRTLVDRVAERRVAAAASLALLVLGVTAAALGAAWAAPVVAAGIGISAFVDRRLPIILLVAMLPGLTHFNPLPAFMVGGSQVDFRLLMTASVAVVLGAQAIALRPRLDPVTAVFGAWVLLLLVLLPLNEAAPQRGLPQLARAADFFLAYLVARSVIRTAGDAYLLGLAVAAGMLPVAASAIIQLLAGEALMMNDAARLSGVYRTSPVGLGMAMQIGMIVLWGLWLGSKRPAVATALAAAAFALFALIMVETSSRLVFATAALGLVLFELWRRRIWMAAAVVVVCGVILVAQPQLAGRIASTVGGDRSPSPSAGPTSSAAPSTNEELPPGDASLRYRLILWSSMLPEWAASPVLGRGTGSFPVILEIKGGERREVPHNDYVGVLVESGVVGLAVFLALQVTVLTRIVRRARIASGMDRQVAMMAGIAFVTINMLSVLNNPMYYLDLQIIVWSLVGGSMWVSDPTTPPAGARHAAAEGA